MRLASQRFLAATVAAFALNAGVAAADPAPIVFAGQGAQNTQTASLTDRLAGGSDESYGYGETRQARRGAVIDIRRVGAPQQQQQAPAVQQQAPQQQAAAHSEEAPAWLERERVGPPYQANGRWYVPTPEPGYEQTGEASWYGPNFHGQATASGETYDQEAMTAAHPTLPLQSLVQVTNLQNGREVIVRINDRGPFVGERLIDLSRAAADVLGFETQGRARVHVRYLGPAPRRVNANGGDVPAPVAPPAPTYTPAPAQVQQAEQEGPVSLLPQDAQPQWTQASMQVSEAPAASGAYVVQVGAFSDLANAHRVRDAVSSAGPVTVDVRRTAAGAELFRVRVGPFADSSAADSARRSLAGLGYPEAVVATR